MLSFLGNMMFLMLNGIIQSFYLWGGKVNEVSSKQLEVTFSPYQEGAENNFHISAVAYDVKGNMSEKDFTTLIADKQDVLFGEGDMFIDKNNAIANGIDQNEVSVEITDFAGHGIPNVDVTFNADDDGVIISSEPNESSLLKSKLKSFSIVTNSDGVAKIFLSSGTAKDVVVTAIVRNISASKTISFVSDSGSAVVTVLSSDKDTALANGTDVVTLTAILNDGSGHLVTNQPVAFSVSSGTGALSAASAVTNSNGEAVVTLTSGDIGSVSVLAKSGNNVADAGQSKAIIFSSDGQIIATDMTVETDNAKADGVERNKIKVKVTRSNGAPLSGESVTFTASNNANLVGANPLTTDTSGLVIIELTSTKVGMSTVTATPSNLVSQNKTVTFSAIPPIPMQGNISVNGATFGMNIIGKSAFPTTGFNGARFTINPSNFEAGKTYNWTVNQSWVSVSNAGEVTFTGSPCGNRTVTITATPQEVGAPLTYTFEVSKWYINDGNTTLIWQDAHDFCLAQGAVLENMLNVGTSPTRELHVLTGEWGDLATYNTSNFTNGYYWINDNTGAPGFSFRLKLTGSPPTFSSDTIPTYVMCVKNDYRIFIMVCIL